MCANTMPHGSKTRTIGSTEGLSIITLDGMVEKTMRESCLAVPSIRRDLLREYAASPFRLCSGLVLLAGPLVSLRLLVRPASAIWAYVGETSGFGHHRSLGHDLGVDQAPWPGHLPCGRGHWSLRWSSQDGAVNLLIALAAIFGLWAFFNFATGFSTRRRGVAWKAR